MMKNSFIHIVTDDQTLEDISKLYYDDFSSQQILDFKDNAKTIFALYNDQEKKDNGEAIVGLLKNGTSLELPVENQKRVLQSSNKDYEPSLVENVEDPFLPDSVFEYLEEKVDYTEFNILDRQLYVKAFNKFYCKVYSRALNTVINISKYILEGTLKVDKNGGSFQFSLAPIRGILKDGNWIMEDIKYFNIEGVNEVEYYSKNNFYLNESDIRKRIDFYFEKVLNPQDLFIVKIDDPFVELDIIDINTSDEYDLIGLVDNVNVSIDQNNEEMNVNIVVTGRGLNKMFIEDGTHFFPITKVARKSGTEALQSFVSNYNSIDDPSIVNRIFGQLKDFEFQQPKPIKELFELIFEKIRNLTGDFDYESGSIFGGDKEQGIWNFVELNIEEEAGKRRLYDSSIRTMSGSILNFFRKLAKEPFVELYFETFKNKYQVIARTPPITKNLYRKNFTISVGDQFLINENTHIDDSEANTWYQLISDAQFLGDNRFSLFMLPAILIEKFAKIYGSRSLRLNHDYMVFALEDIKNDNKKKLASRQSVFDLKFMLEAFSIEPFLRKGSLTFKNLKGIKRGMNLYIPESDMLYYVEGYQHTISVEERKTVVDVSRGIPLRAYDLFFSLIDIQINADENKITAATINEEVLGKLYRKEY